MTRLSPITIAAFSLVLLALATGILVVSRSRDRAERVVVENSPGEASVSPEPAEVTAVVDELRPSAAPRLAVPIVVAGPPEEAQERQAPEIVPIPFDRQSPGVNRRGLAAAVRRRQLLDRADEKALEAIKASDETRIALRRINTEFAKRIETLANSPPKGQPTAEGSHVALDTWRAAEGARREAIHSLFDSDTARAFESAEHAAEGANYRRHWGREIGENAPASSPQPAEPQ